MVKRVKGVVAQLRQEGFDEGKLKGFDEGKQSVIDFLLKLHSVEEISDFFGMPIDEVFNTIKVD